MPAPLVSIVLPTHNGSRFLAEAVQSCLEQSYTYFELILVDDASTDSSPEIISRFQALDSRVTAVRHATNLRLPAALNTGFALARGELLTWTSDDNLYRPGALAVMVNFMKANPQVDVVYTGYSFIDDQGQVIGRHRVPAPDELPYWNAVGACFLYRRSLYERLGGYDEDLFLAEDYEFWLRALGSFRFHALPQDLFLYRVHGDSLSRLDSDRTKFTTRRILEKYLIESSWNQKYRSLAYLRLARDAVALDDKGSARSYFFKAIREWPAVLLGKIAWIALASLILKQRTFDRLKIALRTLRKSS